jgi:hypothetical protein
MKILLVAAILAIAAAPAVAANDTPTPAAMTADEDAAFAAREAAAPALARFEAGFDVVTAVYIILLILCIATGASCNCFWH